MRLFTMFISAQFVLYFKSNYIKILLVTKRYTDEGDLAFDDFVRNKGNRHLF